jgi:hypothetical protein
MSPNGWRARPNVVVAPDKTPAVLVLASAIAGDFVIPATANVSLKSSQ